MSNRVGGRPDGHLRRERAVVLHADIAGYSRLLADDPGATVAAVRAYHNLVTAAVDTAGGTLVNFVGDSFTAVFADARTGMRCAIAICGAVKERNAGLPERRRVAFRMGLDAGEVVIADESRYFGDPINIAARVQAMADVGGVNVTEAIYRELDEPAVRLRPLGARRLKNIPEMVRVYRLTGRFESDDADRATVRARTSSVAVARFHGRNDARDVADGLRLDVIDGLTRIPGLRVIDAIQVPPGGHRQADSADSGDHADYLLTGFVLSSGTTVRVYVSLSDMASMNRVWSRRWERTGDDLFALHDNVTAETVRAVDIELVIGEPARIYRSALTGDALDALYRGLYKVLAGPRSAWRSAVDDFVFVAASPEGEVLGSSLAAFSLWWAVLHGLSEAPDDDLERASTLATRGVELGDQTGLSQIVSAALRLHTGGDPDIALVEANRAAALRPSCDVSAAVEASVHLHLGAWEAAVESAARALRLSPVPRPWYATLMASAYYTGGQYEDAADTAERVLETHPDNLDALLVLGAAQQALGLKRRARATVHTIERLYPGLRHDALWKHQPYRDPTIIDRWATHLSAAGLQLDVGRTRP